jgi:hypothetical protein
MSQSLPFLSVEKYARDDPSGLHFKSGEREREREVSGAEEQSEVAVPTITFLHSETRPRRS